MYTNYYYDYYYYSGYIRILKATSACARKGERMTETRENYFLEYCTQINTREKERQNESDERERASEREKMNEINYRRCSKVIIFYIFLCNFVDAR